MRKRLFISALLIGILGLMSFSGIKFAFAQIEAGGCEQYCSDPYNSETGEGTYIEPSGTFCMCPPTTFGSFEDLVSTVINYIFWFATILMPILIIIGGFYYMTSGGEYEKVNTGKRIITYTIIGYAIILFSWGLVYIIAEVLGQ